MRYRRAAQTAWRAIACETVVLDLTGKRMYGLNAAGSITVSPDRAPGAKRLSEIREKVADAGAVCVFSEPQFEPALVDTVVEGTPARTGVLDPLGAEIEPGPAAYETLLRNLANDLRTCLRPSS